MLSGAVKAEVAIEEKMLPSGTPEAGFYKRLSKFLPQMIVRCQH